MIEIGKKRFNTTGPCFPNEHYMLEALARLPDIETFVASRLYFVLHAARQAGKTTAIKALVKKLNETGRVAAVYCSLEKAQPMGDVPSCIGLIAQQIMDCSVRNVAFSSVSDWLHTRIETPSELQAGSIIQSTLVRLCEATDKSVVIFFDEADCIPAHSIVSFLRQLRDGYVNRDEAPFPMSIALVGMRDIRDYKALLRPDRDTLGVSPAEGARRVGYEGCASPFNVIQEALTLRNFTEAEVGELYAQHTEATGQVFTPEAVHRAYELSDGQPWIVNAIAGECAEKIHKEDLNPITLDDVNAAKTNLIQDRVTTLNSIFRRIHTDWMKRAFDCVGKRVSDDLNTREAIKLAHMHCAVDQGDAIVRYSCPLVEEAISIWRGASKKVETQYAMRSA